MSFIYYFTPWSSEQGAMSYARVPTILDVMLLTGLVDDRLEPYDCLGILESKIEKLTSQLKILILSVITAPFRDRLRFCLFWQFGFGGKILYFLESDNNFQISRISQPNP